MRYENLNDLLSESDCISIHCTHNDETHFILNEKNLNHIIKDTAFIINTSRGGIIDDNALGDAIRNGKIAGAGLDCQLNEPNIFHSLSEKGGPFQNCENKIIVTPHSAFFSEQSILDMKTMSAKEAEVVLHSKNFDFKNMFYRNCQNEKYLNFDRWVERMNRL